MNNMTAARPQPDIAATFPDHAATRTAEDSNLPATDLGAATATDATTAADAATIADDYRHYCRPAIGAMLKALRMDVVFHRAAADSLFYFDVEDEIEITDFLGGYGASLFGHNHPRLVAKAQSLLTNQVPFNAQMSVRGYAAQLAQHLDDKLFDSTGYHYVSTFANSGTEAVEAAIKHARYAFHNRLHGILDSAQSALAAVFAQGFTQGEAEIDTTGIDDAILNGLPKGSDRVRFAFLARQLQQLIEQLRQRAPIFIALEGSFHGKTTGSLALTENPAYRGPFYAQTPDIVFIQHNDTESLLERFNAQQIKIPIPKLLPGGKIVFHCEQICGIAAVFIEPIQGEGGINPIDRAFLQCCRTLTENNRVALVFDEIQSGMGRTGTLLYSSQMGVTADYYTLSKSLGGGLAKISALLVRREHYIHDFGLLHTSTFAEDDFSCALALEALRLLDDDRLPERAATIGHYLKEQLSTLQANYPDVLHAVSGIGLMLGLKFVDHGHSACSSFRLLANQDLFGYAISGYLFHGHRIRVAPSLSQGNTVRLEPSVYISREACDRLVFALTEVCEIIRKMQSHLLLQFIVGKCAVDLSVAHKDYRTLNKPLPPSSPRKKIGFVGHFINADDLVHWDPAFECFTSLQRECFLDQVYTILPPDHTDEIDIDSPNGEKIRLIFSGICATSQHFAAALAAGDASAMREQVQRAVDFLAAKGCAVIGLGAYTSIVTHNCKTLRSDSVALTSGNSLTVGMGLEALKQAAADIGIDWSEAKLSVVGATGNIASTYSELAAEAVRSINLIGRSQVALKRLRRLANRIYCDALTSIIAAQKNDACKNIRGIARALIHSSALQTAKTAGAELDKIDWFTIIRDELGEQAPITIALDMHSIAQSNVVLTASNSAVPIIFPMHLGMHPTAICDISVPSDVDASIIATRPDVKIIQGGHVEIPCCKDFSLKGFNLPVGLSFACLAETVLLGLTGINENYSFGPVTKSNVNKIMHIARFHGFKLGRVTN